MLIIVINLNSTTKGTCELKKKIYTSQFFGKVSYFGIVMCQLGSAWKPQAKLGFSWPRPSKIKARAVVVGLGQLRLGLHSGPGLWENFWHKTSTNIYFQNTYRLVLSSGSSSHQESVVLVSRYFTFSCILKFYKMQKLETLFFFKYIKE